MIKEEKMMGVIVSSEELDNRMELYHLEYAARQQPEYSEMNMINLWLENWELRKKIILCQKEYIQENAAKNASTRQYIKLADSAIYAKKMYEKKIKALEDELSEAKEAFHELAKELKEAQDTITSITESEEEKEND